MRVSFSSPNSPQGPVIAPRPLGRQTQPQAQERVAPNGFILSNEAGYRKRNPSWPQIEAVVSELQPRTKNHFAILESDHLSYVQTLVEPEGWFLEWRAYFDCDRSCWRHLRAHRTGVTGQPELCTKEDALAVFRAFFQGTMGSLGLNWQDLNL